MNTYEITQLLTTLRIDSTEPMERMVARLNDFQPRSLVAYASIARSLAQEQTAGRLRISPQAVFCAGEVLTGDVRETALGKTPLIKPLR